MSGSDKRQAAQAAASNKAFNMKFGSGNEPGAPANVADEPAGMSSPDHPAGLAGRHDRILRRPEVEARTGLSRSTIYDMMAAGTFPRPLRLGRRAVGWTSGSIEDWLETRQSALPEQAGG